MGRISRVSYHWDLSSNLSPSRERFSSIFNDGEKHAKEKRLEFKLGKIYNGSLCQNKRLTQMENLC